MENNLPGYLNHPSWLANLATKELEEWVDRHPFFAAVIASGKKISAGKQSETGAATGTGCSAHS